MDKLIAAYQDAVILGCDKHARAFRWAITMWEQGHERLFIARLASQAGVYQAQCGNCAGARIWAEVITALR